MKFLVIEILSYLIAAGILGLIVGWGLKSSNATKKISRLRKQWDQEKMGLTDTKKSEITNLGDKNDTLLSEITSLRNKIDSLTASIELGNEAVVKAKAETRAFQEYNDSQGQTTRLAQSKVADLSTAYTHLERKLDAVMVAKDQEIQKLRQQLSAKSERPYSRAEPAFSRAGMAKSNASTTDSVELDDQISALHEERERLIHEREKFVTREQLFASQLSYGDDTQAYFDETIKLGSIDRPGNTHMDAPNDDLPPSHHSGSSGHHAVPHADSYRPSIQHSELETTIELEEDLLADTRARDADSVWDKITADAIKGTDDE